VIKSDLKNGMMLVRDVDVYVKKRAVRHPIEREGTGFGYIEHCLDVRYPWAVRKARQCFMTLYPPEAQGSLHVERLFCW
jgi:uncharacterized protein YheU (UPF0270 family)